MSADIASVLIVPSEVPCDLLRVGLSSAPPAFVSRLEEGTTGDGSWGPWTAPYEHSDHWGDWRRQFALPLWWRGALVPEGWDRLCRVLDRWPKVEALANALWLALAAQEAGLGRVVCLDHEGREVPNPAERR